jgi:hypothetical protein
MLKPGFHSGTCLPPGAVRRYDSVIANIDGRNQAHREIMIFDRAQAYPEYILYVEEGR